MPLRHFCHTFATILGALCLCACATGLHPYAGHDHPRLELLQDEVQRTGEFISETAPAGVYVAKQENNDYVFYEGSAGIIERAYFNKPGAAVGGIAVSKRDPHKARLYTIGPGGAANMERYLRTPFVLKP
jgi:hypothetical protein